MSDSTDQLPQPNLSLNQVTQLIRAVTANRERPLGRAAWAGGRIGFSSDSSRPNAWDDYGYPDVVTFDMLYNMYRRNGIARAGVEIPVSFTWQSLPTVYEGMNIAEAESREERTEWEAAFDELADRLRLWQKLQGVDRRQRVGQYAALYVQVRGSGEEARMNTELGRVRSDQIVRLIPLYEGQLQPTRWDTNPKSERYGMPVMYQLNESAIDGEAQERPRQGQVHHSRIIIAAENADDDSIYSEPCNLAGFNHLIDIEKILGASGEGLHKNASQKLVFNSTDPEAGEPDPEEQRDFDEVLEAFTRNMGKHLETQGVDVTNLQSSLVDPQPFFDINLNAYAASVQLPGKILIGTQTGVLAGESDNEQLLQSMQARREGWGTELVASFIDWCVKHGALDSPADSYCMDWPDIMEPSFADKLALVKSMAEVNQLGQFTTGSVFGQAEMRIAAGFAVMAEADIDDEVEVPQETEALPEGEPTGDRPASDAARSRDGSVQSEALNGAQMNAIRDIVKDVALGQLPPEAAIQLIIVSFPLVDEAQARKIVAPAATFTPRQPEGREGAQ